MEFEIPRRWVTLSPHVDVAGTIWLGVSDDRGDGIRPPDDSDAIPAGWMEVPVPRRDWHRAAFYAVWLPEEALALVNRAMRDLPTERTNHPHATGPVPLPLFVPEPASGRWTGVAWDSLVHDVLAALGLNPDRLQPIRLGKQAPQRPPFRLPLRLLTVGGESLQLTYRIGETRGLIAREEGLQRYGIDSKWEFDPSRTAATLTEAPRDVVVVPQVYAEQVLRASERVSPAAVLRPRLVIVLGDGEPLQLPSAPLGTSVLTVPLPTALSGADFVVEALYGIVHDFPLHEVVKSALRQVPAATTVAAALGPAWLPHLVATPQTIHDLRMADAYEQLIREAGALSAHTNPGDVDLLVRRANLSDQDLIARELRMVAAGRQQVDTAAAEVGRLTGDFAREQWGLWPLARAERSVEAARHAAADVGRRYRSLAGRPRARRVLEANQERRVEFRLGRVEHSPIMSDPLNRGPFLNRNVVLRGGARYSLEVGIGQQWETEHNLAPEGTPPVEPVLPPSSEGHELDVVVFEGDFGLAGAARQTIRLPPGAASEVATFELMAPEPEGPAAFRICVYYLDHILQAFRIETLVGPEEGLTEEPAIRSQLEFARTERFTNIDRLGRRAASIAVNRNGGSHTFLVKRLGTSKSISLTEKTLGTQIDGFRDVLRRAVHGQIDGADAVRALADAGHALGLALWGNVKPLREELSHLRESRDETIQVVRLDPEYAFPWTIIYDWDPPEQVVGDEPPPACLGRVGQARCGHGPDDGVYCVNGFWGIRHVVEEFLNSDHRDDAVETVAPASPLVRLAAGAKSDVTVRLQTRLGRDLGLDRLAEVTATDTLLDLLWDARRRPAICIVLGHLRTSPVTGEPNEPRILTGSKEQFLRANEVTKRHRKLKTEWEQPRTVMLLMACESGVTELAKLNSFVSALMGAGAAAVGCTESEVGIGIASDFARSLTRHLARGQPLGAGVTRFRRRVIADGNPLAFAFTAFGGANLTVAQ